MRLHMLYYRLCGKSVLSWGQLGPAGAQRPTLARPLFLRQQAESIHCLSIKGVPLTLLTFV